MTGMWDELMSDIPRKSAAATSITKYFDLTSLAG